MKFTELVFHKHAEAKKSAAVYEHVYNLCRYSYLVFVCFVTFKECCNLIGSVNIVVGKL